MGGLMKFLLGLWFLAGIGIVRGLVRSDAPFGEAVSAGAPLIALWVVVGVVLVGGLVLMGIVATHSERARLRRFVERRSYNWGEDLKLDAPEAYMLINDGEVNPTEVFKAGILQAIAVGELHVDGENAIERRPSADGPVRAVGSVAALTRSGGGRTSVKECVERIKAKYGSAEKFIEREVAPRLFERNYWAEGFGPTSSGRRAKAILEGRVGAALYDMQARGGPSIDGDPWNALIAALVMVTGDVPMKEAAEGVDRVDQARVGQGLPLGAYAASGLAAWVAMDVFDGISSDIDSAISDGGFGDGGGDGDFGGDFEG